MSKPLTDIARFSELDVRTGTILSARRLEGARKPAYKMSIDFGPVGIRTSSAQLTELYAPENLIGKRIIAIVNFPPMLIAGFKSECLILGVYTKDGVVLLSTDKAVENGKVIG